MKRFHFTDKPIKVFGVPHFEEKKRLRRLPEEMAERYRGKLQAFPRVGLRCPGARMCFRTNSKKFRIGIELDTLTVNIGMSLFSCQSAHVLIGNRKDPFYAGLVYPANYEQKSFSREFTKSAEMEDVTVFLPMEELIGNAWVEIEDDAKIEAPTEYKHQTPMLFYGSSITEGAHASRPCNAYTALLSARLDADYYNFGFSGSAKGHLEFAEYICTLDMSVFILDYDHNAPDTEHLRATHEPFFRYVRERKPSLPIVILTRPNFEQTPDATERRAIIRQTYEHALSNGDKNVYFVDGEQFFGNTERYACTSDGTHPNDLGHYRMANHLAPILQEIFDKQQGK